MKVVTEVRLALFDSGEVNAYQQFVEFLENNRAANAQEEAMSAQQGVQTVQCGEPTGPATVTKASEPVTVEAPAKEVTEADVVTSLRDFITRKGVDSAVALLAEFGVKRAGELKPEDRAKFVARMAA